MAFARETVSCISLNRWRTFVVSQKVFDRGGLGGNTGNQGGGVPNGKAAGFISISVLL